MHLLDRNPTPAPQPSPQKPRLDSPASYEWAARKTVSLGFVTGGALAGYQIATWGIKADRYDALSEEVKAQQDKATPLHHTLIDNQQDILARQTGPIEYGAGTGALLMAGGLLGFWINRRLLKADHAMDQFYGNLGDKIYTLFHPKKNHMHRIK